MAFTLESGTLKHGKLPKCREDGQQFWWVDTSYKIASEAFLLAAFFHKLPNRLLPNDAALPTTKEISPASPMREREKENPKSHALAPSPGFLSDMNSQLMFVNLLTNL